MATREDYANDLDDSRSSTAVTGGSNRSKSDQDPAEWMPPAASTTCDYVERRAAVKTRWVLSADQSA